MTPGARLDALIGTWRTLRVIRPAEGPVVRFEGVTIWARDGDLVRSGEAGHMVQAGARFEARRETLWSVGPDGIEVRFADGRPFHVVGAGATGTAHHDCAPDTYLLRYDFRAWPHWSVRWRVTGPRKDYRALTRYVRAAS